MFANRTNQENLAYAHQTTAASKPLNHGIKGLESKTPGPKAPKTPFRANRQNENENNNNYNGNGNGKTNLNKTGPAKPKQDVFVTPAGPRTRAPLGMKTTNAKANAFQTPVPLAKGKQAPPQSVQKPLSPRLRRARVKIHQAEPETSDATETANAEPEIEYMPPRSVPLPDYPSPEDLPPLDYARIFDPETMFAQMAAYHADPLVDDNGTRLSDRKLAQLRDESDRAIEREISQGLARDPYMRQASSLLNPPPATLNSRSAASALARPTAAVPGFAAPTAATRARKNVQSNERGAAGGAHAAAAAASRSTLGYSKGRSVSASKRPGLSPAHRAGVVKKAGGGGAASVAFGAVAPFGQMRKAEGVHLIDEDEDAQLEEMLRRAFEEARARELALEGGAEGVTDGIGGLSLEDGSLQADEDEEDEEDEASKDFVLGPVE